MKTGPHGNAALALFLGAVLIGGYTVATATQPAPPGDIIVSDKELTVKLTDDLKINTKMDLLNETKILLEVSASRKPSNQDIRGRRDVQFAYLVENIGTENTIVWKEKTVAVGSFVSFVEVITLSDAIKPGRYSVTVTGILDDEMAASLITFDAAEHPPSWHEKPPFISAMSGFLVFAIWNTAKRRKIGLQRRDLFDTESEDSLYGWD